MVVDVAFPRVGKQAGPRCSLPDRNAKSGRWQVAGNSLPRSLACPSPITHHIIIIAKRGKSFRQTDDPSLLRAGTDNCGRRQPLAVYHLHPPSANLPTELNNQTKLSALQNAVVEFGALAALSAPVIRAVFGSDTTEQVDNNTDTETKSQTTTNSTRQVTTGVQSGTPALEQKDPLRDQTDSSRPDQIDASSSPKLLPAPKPTSEDTPSVSPVDEAVEIQSSDHSPRSDEVKLPPPISLDSLPGYRTLVTAPATFDYASATSIGSPVQAHSAEREEDSENKPESLPAVVAASADTSEGVIPQGQEHENNTNMGLFSAITNNINKPDNSRRTSMHRSNTAKTTGTTATTATNATGRTEQPAVVPTGTGTGIVTGDTIVPAAARTNESSAKSVNETPAVALVDQDRPVTPVPASVIDAPPAQTTEIGDRAVTPAPRTDRTESVNGDRESYAASPVVPAAALVAEGRDPVNAPNGIEPPAINVQSSRASEYTNDQDYPERPAFHEQPSRSYIKGRENGTDAGSIRNSVRNSELPPTVTESVIEHAPAVLERTDTGAPKVIDYSTASPANLGDREHVGGVVVLPAGGALQHGRDESVYQPREEQQERLPEQQSEYTGGDRQTERAESPRKSVETARKSVETQRQQPNGNGAAVYENQQQPAGEIRQLMHEGQAYREDGLVHGQPAYQQQPQVVPPHSYAPIAGATAGGMISSAVGQGYRQEQQQQYQPQLQQQQPRYPDQSFANERAMSPGPELGMQRLAIDPAHQQHLQQQQPMGNGSNVGPSPGPPVTAFKPTAPSPSRTLGASAADGGLDRSNTYRTGVSRGSTIRRGGAFANGSALSGGGVAETYGREDIHNRNDLATRNLIAAGKPGEAVSRRISTAEKKDAKRMSKLIVKEGHIEAAAVKASMKELESLQKMQKAAAQEELKAQKLQTKALQVHDKAYKKFLKQKEAYDRIEAELRSREEQYEATRQHAQAQTEILAQKSAELNDLRAQKAADDREREMRLLALKNPGAA